MRSDQSANPMKALIDDIVAILGREKTAVGSRIPSERQLAAMLGESRSRIRKALDAMRHEGMVEVLPQVGTILKSTNPCVTTFQKVLNMESIDLQSLIELRVSLEVTAAGLAAKRATAGDVAAIEKACAEYEKEASAYCPWHDENLRFHMTVVHASRNGAIVAIMENVLKDTAIYTRSRQSFYTLERLNRSIAEHRAIVDAIRARDESRAIDAMTFHMRKMSSMADELSKIMQ